LQNALPQARIEVTAGPQKSEFAVFLDGAPLFSRLEQRRFPEAEELLNLCHAAGH
jgi:selT/selW/selH-like putative selenoprotein